MNQSGNNDLRKRMEDFKRKQQSKVEKIESPLLRYLDSGQLSCTICKVVIPSEKTWNIHVKTNLHLENMKKLKEIKDKKYSVVTVAKKRLPTPPKPKEVPEKRSKPNPDPIRIQDIDTNNELDFVPKNQLPKTFFDDPKKDEVLHMPKPKNKILKPNLNKIKTMLDKRNELLKKPTKKVANKKKQSLRDRMLQRLKSAQFRLINDTLSKKESSNLAHVIDNDSFETYHEGYQNQMANWPIKPVEVLIESLSKLPETYVVADMGCGNAILLKSIKQKVHSFDLKVLNENVTQCDMANTPLENSSVNVVVFSLSLINCPQVNLYIQEANRILKFGGLMLIAELESRFEDVDEFVNSVEGYGFSLSKKDLKTQYFYFFDFIKVSNIKNQTHLKNIYLKPYTYKKR